MRTRLLELESLYDRDTSIIGVPTGYHDLDEQLLGLQPSTLSIVAARPSMGKTAFVMNIAENAAIEDQQVVGAVDVGDGQRQLVADATASRPDDAEAGPGGHCGATQESSAVDLPPHIDTSDQPLPGPANTTLRPPPPARKAQHDNALTLGASQILALLPGISRDGTVMVAGMFRGLTRQDAARFSFLLSAPVILAAGVLKIPDLTGPLGAGIRGPILFGSLLSGVSAFFALRFLVRYFSDPKRTLTPFAIYCLAAGAGAFIYLAVRLEPPDPGSSALGLTQ